MLVVEGLYLGLLLGPSAQIGKLLRVAAVIRTITFVREQILVEVVGLGFETVAGPFDRLSYFAGRVLH